MPEDNNITAIWEEDGDLMRLKVYFGYAKAEDELKSRIKEKALSKISDTEKGLPPTQTQTADKKTKSNIFSLFSGPRGKWSKARKRASVYISAAAVVVLAVSLGTSGLLMGDKSNTQMSQVQQEKNLSTGTDESSRESGTVGGVAPEFTAPQTADISTSNTTNGSDRLSTTFKDSAASTQNPNAANNIAEQKIIYSLDVSLKAKDVTVAAKALEEKTKGLGGYVAESTVSNYDNTMTAYLSLRIPAKQYDAFKSGLSQYGTVDSEHQYTEDVSSAYMDTETRLRSWEAQEQRYLEILKKANTVDDILKIENSLATVRQEIESLKGQLKYWDNRVEYSQVTINIVQLQSDLSVKDPWQPISLINTLIAIKNALIKTVSFLWNALNYVLVFIGYALPVVIIILLIWLIYRTVRKRTQFQKRFHDNAQENSLEKSPEESQVQSEDNSGTER